MRKSVVLEQSDPLHVAVSEIDTLHALTELFLLLSNPCLLFEISEYVLRTRLLFLSSLLHNYVGTFQSKGNVIMFHVFLVSPRNFPSPRVYIEWVIRNFSECQSLYWGGQISESLRSYFFTFIFLHFPGLWRHSDLPPVYRPWDLETFPASSSFEYRLLAKHQAKREMPFF